MITGGNGVVARIGDAAARSALRSSTRARPRYTQRLPRCGVRRRRRWADACHPWFAIFVEGSADNEKKDDGDVKRARD